MTPDVRNPCELAPNSYESLYKGVCFHWQYTSWFPRINMRCPCFPTPDLSQIEERLNFSIQWKRGQMPNAQPQPQNYGIAISKVWDGVIWGWIQHMMNCVERLCYNIGNWCDSNYMPWSISPVCKRHECNNGKQSIRWGNELSFPDSLPLGRYLLHTFTKLRQTNSE